MKRIILTLSLILFSLSLGAKELNSARLDSLITAIENNDKGMGSLSIFRNGEEIYQRSFSYADIENGVKADAQTVYRIGSISKTFTATIIMKLVEEGKLSLDTKLADYFPQIFNASNITIKHMLEHTSGITNYMKADYLDWNTKEHSRERLLERIVSCGNDFAPGSKFAYSNSNYALLAFIAEDITGKEYSTLIDEMITTPCGLKSTYVSGKLNPVEHEALSYIKSVKWEKQPETDMTIAIGAGSLGSTPAEVNTFLYNLFTGKLLSDESLEAMKPKKGMFGFGVARYSLPTIEGYGHDGGIDGFISKAYYIPENGLGVVLMQNGVSFSPNDFLKGIFLIATDQEYDIPQFSPVIRLSEEQMQPFLGLYSTAAPMPMDINIFMKEGVLFAQATNQPSFPLECFTENKFRNERVGAEFEFVLDEDKFILKQHGVMLEFKRKQGKE